MKLNNTFKETDLGAGIASEMTVLQCSGWIASTPRYLLLLYRISLALLSLSVIKRRLALLLSLFPSHTTFPFCQSVFIHNPLSSTLQETRVKSH